MQKIQLRQEKNKKSTHVMQMCDSIDFIPKLDFALKASSQ